jgi:ABC-type phosphate transport system permease subunit
MHTLFTGTNKMAHAQIESNTLCAWYYRLRQAHIATFFILQMISYFLKVMTGKNIAKKPKTNIDFFISKVYYFSLKKSIFNPILNSSILMLLKIGL